LASLPADGLGGLTRRKKQRGQHDGRGAKEKGRRGRMNHAILLSLGIGPPNRPTTVDCQLVRVLVTKSAAGPGRTTSHWMFIDFISQALSLQ
jgi:hypothetical protein